MAAARPQLRPGSNVDEWPPSALLEPGWVFTYLTLGNFMAGVNLTSTLEFVRDALAECPRVRVRTHEEVRAGA